jgi:hypothetical protein
MPNFFTNWFNKAKNGPKRKKTKKDWVFWGVFILFMLSATYLFIYHQVKGIYPISFLNKQESILPPGFNSETQTFDNVLSFVRSDDTNTIPYREEFNCENSVLRVWQNAKWHGLISYPVAILYDKPPGHMVILFPTIDQGDVFFETQNDSQIKLKVGEYYNGGKIKGLYVMHITWIPLQNSPQLISIPEMR